MRGQPSVLFLGSPYWCAYLADLLNGRKYVRAFTSKNAFAWLFSRRKVICYVGLGPPDTYKRMIYHFPGSALDRCGFIVKRVIYWIGSDVIRLNPGSGLVARCTNVAGSPWLATEIRQKGYECSERLFPVELKSQEELPFPDASRLQVLCYIPDAHHDLHGSSEIRFLAERFKRVDFTVVGGVGSWWPNSPNNVVFKGWVDDLNDYLRNAHVLLRRTAHDSLSAFVREGLATGRQVIFTYDVPGVIYVKRGDLEALSSRLEELDLLLDENRFSGNRLDHNTRSALTDTDSQLAALAEIYG